MLAADTVYRRMQYGSVIYGVTAEVTTDCGNSCVGVDFSNVETALVKSIQSADPDANTIESVVSTELASTGQYK